MSERQRHSVGRQDDPRQRQVSSSNGSQEIAGWADFSADSGAGWVFVEGPIAAGLLGSAADAFTEIQIVGFVTNATGTVYIDGVTID